MTYTYTVCGSTAKVLDKDYFLSKKPESKEVYLKSELNKVKRGYNKNATEFDKFNPAFLHETASHEDRTIKVRPRSSKIKRGYTLTNEYI